MNQATNQTPGAPATVEAVLSYLARPEAAAVYIASVGGGEVAPHQGEYAAQRVTMHNARLHAGAFSLDREGFKLVPHHSTVSDFYDDEQVARIYEDEVKVLLRAATGAARIDIFDHTRRSASGAVRKSRLIREPSATVHNDYTERSAPNRLRAHFAHAPEEAEALLARRFAIVNVWRSIAGTVRSAPLALCDASSVAPSDLVAVERRAQDRIGELQLALYNPQHRWYWYPAMTMDEAVLIKTYDSATDGRIRFTIHSAFTDPGAAVDSPPRESMETRCFAFF
jgi:hypothetical protein